MIYYVAVWDSRSKTFSHWRFGRVEASSVVEALRKVLPYSDPKEAYGRDIGYLTYDWDGDAAVISADKDWVAERVSEIIKEIDFYSIDLD